MSQGPTWRTVGYYMSKAAHEAFGLVQRGENSAGTVNPFRQSYSEHRPAAAQLTSGHLLAAPELLFVIAFVLTDKPSCRVY